MSVDGTDFKINHPTAAGDSIRNYYSYKLNHSGLRYEVGVCIQTGHIVWSNGPFKPGLFNDISMFRDSLVLMLEPGEKVEADRGYRGEPDAVEDPDYFEPNTPEMKAMKTNVRARHEAINGRIKNWGAMRLAWRHNHGFHGVAFRAIIMLINISFDLQAEPPQVFYQTRPIPREDDHENTVWDDMVDEFVNREY